MEDKGHPPGYDIFRDSPLRYLGYANELGEAFRPIFPLGVVPSYMVAMCYVNGHAIDRTLTTYENTKNDATIPQETKNYMMLNSFVDTLLWQTFASVAIPGIFINRTVAAASFASQSVFANNAALRKWTPTFVGLGVIPLIVEPIDNSVDAVMDNTIRPWMRSMIHGS